MSQAPPLNLDTKPKRSVSFLNHDPDNKKDSRLGRSSFQPGRRKSYVRKGPVQSDDESEEDEIVEEEEEEEEQDQPAMNTADNSAGYEPATSYVSVNVNATADVNFKEINRPISQTLMSKAAVRPGQNYVRKAPVNSDTESETDEEAEQVQTSSPSKHGTTAGTKPTVDGSGSESDRDKEAGGLVRSFAAHARIAGPGQNYVRKAPVNSDTESDEEGASAASKANLTNPVQGNAPVAAGLQGQGRPASTILNQNLANASATALNASSPVHSRVQSHEVGLLGVSSGATPHQITPGVGMTMANTSATSLNNSSSASAQTHLASSMAIYQQQQQEMMLIMQQQQIQIATMQQQQQAYQLLVLQQQQHHQQQLQAVQMQHSRATSSNGSVIGKDVEDDSDDDVPLGEKQQQLPVIPALPELPQFTSLMGTTTTPAQSGTPPLEQPQPVLAGAGSSAAHILMQSSPQLQDGRPRQTSVSSVHSVRSGSPNPMMTLPHLHALPLVSSPLNPATSSPLLQHQTLALQQQQQPHAFSEGDLQHPPPQLGPGSLLTSGFPAGYRHSIQSLSLGQSNPDRGSVTSLHSTGSNGSSGSGSGSKPTNNPVQRHSFMAQSPAQHLQLQQQLYQQQQLQQLQQQQQQQQQQHLLPYQHHTLLQSLTPSPTGSPLSFMGHPPHAQQQQQQQHHHSTLIHVEAKPPPPQTGLVGAITAMERDKKLAKAQGTNQLQYQHQQQQHQMHMSAEKERWLQEQRRLAWESSGQMPPQQQQLQQQQQLMNMQQLQFQQQQQQLLYPNMTLAQQQQPQPWTAEDEDEDNKPLGGH